MMEYKSNQHRQMAKVKNILSQIFFPKRLESSSHESYSGSCGDHAQWNLNPENGELRITGTGPLYDFFGEKEVPWESHLNHIRKVVVAHGITYIGFQAFSYCKSLSSVQLPDTLTGIGQHAFAYWPYPHIHTRQCHPVGKRSVRRLQKPDGNKAPRRTVATQKQ